MQLQAARESNALQKEMFDKNQENLQPYLETGGVANTKLRELLNLGYPEYGKKFTGPEFKQPGQFDPSKVQFDPGFQYRMDQSTKAIERFAAKSGTFLSGGTGAKLIRNAQDMVSQEYGAAYNRAAGQQQVDYAQNVQGQQEDYQRKLQEFLNDYNIFSGERSGRYEQLARAAGLGADATGQLNQLGSSYAANVGSTNINAARGAAESLEGGANATAAGRVGSANAWTGALASGANNIQQMLTLQMLLDPKTANTAWRQSNQNFYNPSSLQPNYARG